MYNWQNESWPHFTYSLTTDIENKLYIYAQESSRLTSLVHNLDSGFDDALLELMVLEAQKTSEIEGELIKIEDIRSSLKQQMGLPFDDYTSHDKRAQGISFLLVDVRKTFKDELTQKILHDWHRNLMNELNPDLIGCFRTNPEPMQIVSGAIGREKVFFEAPPSDRVADEMLKFIIWYNERSQIPGPIRAAIGHLYFESIHPYIDGNGRIGRILVEKTLSQDLGYPVLFSLSNTLMQNRKKYYELLHLNSKLSLDVSSWVEFFVDMVFQAQMKAKDQINFVLQKSIFWKNHSGYLNERQKQIIKRMMASGVDGFIGGMSAKKYMTITNCSKATATRDLADLLRKKCLLKLEEQGPNTRYKLCFEG